MRSPENTNYYNPQGFIVLIKRLPNVSFFCNSVNIPGLSITNPTQSNPFIRMPIPGDQAAFENLTIQFHIDENLKNWIEVAKWMISISFPEDHEQFKFAVDDPSGSLVGSDKNLYSNISIIVLGSDKSPQMEFEFFDCVPNSLSGLDLTVNDSDINPISASATFDFSYVRINKPGTSLPIDQMQNL